MSYKYQVACDKCHNVVQDSDFKKSLSKEVALNNWFASLYAHWLEDSDDEVYKELKTEREFDYTFCQKCSLEFSNHVKLWVSMNKNEDSGT